MKTQTKARELATIFGGAACVLVACSVDTSGIRFEDDSLFGGGVANNGGMANVGGVLNKGGTKGKAGSDSGEGGEDTGGSETGGVGPNGGVGPSGGVSAGGTPPSGGGNANMGGMGGMPPMNGYPCTERRQPAKLVADFSMVTSATSTWQDSMMGMTYGLYTFPPGAGAPLLKFGDGDLTAEAKVTGPSGFGIWFSPCGDVKTPGYLAVGFRLSGTRLDGQPLVIRVGLGINANRMADPMLQAGGCVPPMAQDPGYCRPPATEVQLDADWPADGMFVSIPFDQFRSGSPMPNVDSTQITAIEWGFIYLNGQPAYDANITVDDVSFN